MAFSLRSLLSSTKSRLSLAFCFLSTLQAASIDDLTFQIIEEQAVLTKCDQSAAGSLTIPSRHEGFSVTRIAEGALQECRELTEVNLPEGLLSIGSEAFTSCEELTSVTLPTTLTHIGDDAFDGCSKLTNLELPNNLLSIGDNAFSRTKLSSLQLGAAVSGIGDRFVKGCDELTSIEVDASNLTYQSIDGILYNKAGDILIRCPPGRSAPVVIPDEVTFISPFSFRECNLLREVQFGTAVRDIGEYAFSYSDSLSTVVINDGLETIGTQAFYDCTALKLITLPDGLLEIGSRAFYECNSLTKLTIPDTVTTIGTAAFYRCRALTVVNFPNSLVSIGESVFSYCENLEHVEIPNGITEIPYRTFLDVDTLSAIGIPASVETIGRDPFKNCDALNHFYFEGDAPASVEGTNISSGSSLPKAYVRPEHVDSFGGIGADWYGLEVVTYDFYLIDSVQGRGWISGNARTYSSNSNVTLTAVPEAGSVFIGWRGDITGDRNPLNISMNSNLVIEAVFVDQARYGRVAIQIDSDGDGLSNTFEATPDSNALNNLGFYSTSQMTDARPGAVMLQKTPRGDAMLSLQIERSRNLESWTQNQEDLINVSISLDQNSEFLRFSMDTK